MGLGTKSPMQKLKQSVKLLYHFYVNGRIVRLIFCSLLTFQDGTSNSYVANKVGGWLAQNWRPLPPRRQPKTATVKIPAVGWLTRRSFASPHVIEVTTDLFRPNDPFIEPRGLLRRTQDGGGGGGGCEITTSGWVVRITSGAVFTIDLTRGRRQPSKRTGQLFFAVHGRRKMR